MLAKSHGQAERGVAWLSTVAQLGWYRECDGSCTVNLAVCLPFKRWFLKKIKSCYPYLFLVSSWVSSSLSFTILVIVNMRNPIRSKLLSIRSVQQILMAKSHGQAKQGSCLAAHSCADRFVYVSSVHSLLRPETFYFMKTRSLPFANLYRNKVYSELLDSWLIRIFRHYAVKFVCFSWNFAQNYICHEENQVK